MKTMIRISRVLGVCGSCNLAIASPRSVSGDVVRVGACCVQAKDEWGVLMECINEERNEWTYKPIYPSDIHKELVARMDGSQGSGDAESMFMPLLQATPIK